MKSKGYNRIFSIAALIVLLCYLLNYLFSNTAFIYASIFFGASLVLLNIFTFKTNNLNEGINMFGLKLYNLDKFILGILALWSLFISNSDIPDSKIYLLSYSLFTLGLLTSIRVLKR